MAVAIERMADELRNRVVRWSAKKKDERTKYFGKCQMPNDSVNVIIVKAMSELEASQKLHKGYRIKCVLDLLTEDQMGKEWDKIKPSLIQRSQLR